LNVGILIPAYNPPVEVVPYIKQLAETEIPAIIVVNDGSGEEYEPLFMAIAEIKKVTLLNHAINLGKGAALKTGLNYAYCNFRNFVGFVTADADGQHLQSDILKVAQKLIEHPRSLVLGVRSFDEEIPFRSRFGNLLTKRLFRLLVGLNLADTQTGLRGIPMEFIPDLLKMDSKGYEFELDMLLACKLTNRNIIEQEIETVYLNGNRSSHFNPIIDSMKIYFVLLRFIIISLMTACIDYGVFLLAYYIFPNILLSQFAARSVALVFNYLAVKRVVFYSNQSHKQVFPKYVALVIVAGLVSYAMINFFTFALSIDLILSKILAELIIYFANYAVQREFIFVRGSLNAEPPNTDWDSYYSKPYKTASYTRRITGSKLAGLIRQYGTMFGGKIRIAELGGANSCFYELIQDRIKPSEYHIIDNNELGLAKFKNRVDQKDSVFLHNKDVLRLDLNKTVDIAFSVGLIEHFSPPETAEAIRAHFSLLESKGIAIISFPTPTPLYLITRFFARLLGLWIFHDERPLKRAEVQSVVEGYGTVLYSNIIWSIFLTQLIMVVKKD
jgi:putative flippase GtrA